MIINTNCSYSCYICIVTPAPSLAIIQQPLTCTVCTSSCFSASSCSRLWAVCPNCSFSLAADAASSSLLSLSISTWQQHEGDIMWTTLPWLFCTHVPSCNACSRSQAQSLSVLTVHLHVSIASRSLCMMCDKGDEYVENGTNNIRQMTHYSIMKQQIIQIISSSFGCTSSLGPECGSKASD